LLCIGVKPPYKWSQVEIVIAFSSNSKLIFGVKISLLGCQF